MFAACSMKFTQDFVLQATNMQGLGTRLEGREMKSGWKEKKRGEGMREKESRKGSKEGRETKRKGRRGEIHMIKMQQPVSTFSMAAYTLSPLSLKVMATSELPVTALANTWTHAIKQYQSLVH